MKKLIVAAASLGLVISSSFAQGYFNFDNSANYGSSLLLPTISGGTPGEGAEGQVIGSDPTFATPNYDITYLWMLGTTYSGQDMEPYQFAALGATQGAVANFLGPTGDTADGAGVVSAGYQYPTGLTGSPNGTLITIQLVAWYDPTGSGVLPGHDQFGNYGADIGWSQLETIKLSTSALNAADISTIPPFTVGAVIPEPSILALSGIGAGALALVRRRKQV